MPHLFYSELSTHRARTLATIVGSIAMLALTGCQSESETEALMTASAMNPPVSGWYRYENAAGSRDYLLEVPVAHERAGAAAPPLIVYLHGCGQSAEDVSRGTGWTELARAQGFVLVYPEQPDGRCWTWFQAAHQHRDAGEPSIIAGIVREVAARLNADPRRIYVLGASAGAYMSNILGAAYPELFAAIGILAGGPYGLGTDSVPDITGSETFAEMGPNARVMPVFVAQGSADPINPAAAAALAVQQWLGLADHVDDGALNGSVPRTPASQETALPQQPPQPGSGEPCLANAPNICPGGLLGLQDHYPYTVLHYVDGAGEPLIEFWIGHGVTHNYTGGDPAGSYTDPLGPGLTDAAYAFFLTHPM